MRPSGGSTISEVRLSNSRSIISNVRARRRRAREAIDIGERGEEDGVSRGEIGVGVPEETIGAPAQLRDLVVGQRRPAFERLGAFERGRAVVQPDALQIGMAVGAEGSLPGGPLSRNGRRASDDGGESHQQRERSTVHLNLRSPAHQKVR